MESPIIVALDFDDQDAALALADGLQPELCRLKVGKELFTRAGPQLLEQLHGRGFQVFLDLKYHDIPNTVAGAIRAASDLGVWMVNVHASGGRRMMEAAREAVSACPTPPLLIAVTVLTSLSGAELAELGWRDSAQERVSSLAALAAASGMDGVVCSAREASMLKAERGAAFKLVTPGIRLAEDAAGDQRRVATPVDAMRGGSDFLVIGRSITQSPAPVQTLQRILLELDVK